MAGPTQNFTPGNVASTASANKCAVECQKVDFPSASSQVMSFNAASLLMEVEASLTTPSIEAAMTFFAKPSEIPLATAMGVMPCS